MSMWRKTLEYLGLQEEQDDYHDMSSGHAGERRVREPAMHDTTGPIPVVRSEAESRGQSRQPSLRPVDDPDLTEPVTTVQHGDEARSERPDARGGTTRQPPAGRDRDEHDNVRHLHRDRTAGTGRRVAIVAVADYEAGAREVGQRFRQRVPVVFDLTDAPAEDRRRVLDFVAGVTFALQGEMLKVGRRSFLVVPEGGTVSDDEWERLAGLGYRP